MEIQRQFNVKAVSALFPSKYKQRIVKGTHNYLRKSWKLKSCLQRSQSLVWRHREFNSPGFNNLFHITAFTMDGLLNVKKVHWRFPDDD